MKLMGIDLGAESLVVIDATGRIVAEASQEVVTLLRIGQPTDIVGHVMHMAAAHSTRELTPDRAANAVQDRGFEHHRRAKVLLTKINHEMRSD